MRTLSNILYFSALLFYTIYGVSGSFFWGLNEGSNKKKLFVNSLSISYWTSICSWILCWFALLFLLVTKLKLPWFIVMTNGLLLFISVVVFWILANKKNKSHQDSANRITPFSLFILI